MKSIYIKSISIILSLIIVFNYTEIAYPQTSPQSIVSGSRPDIYIPEQYGKINSSEFGVRSSEYLNKKPQVILINDAHCVYEAQKNIEKILDMLIRDYKIDLVCVEGASGKVDASVFQSVPDKTVRERASDKFIKKGYLTASEALQISRAGDLPFTIWGVEDAKLYVEDLKLFRETIKTNADAIKFTKNAGERINNIKNNIYNPELKEFDKKLQKYKRNEIPLTEYIKEIADCGNSKNFNLTIRAIKLEEGIDFNKVEEEREKLIKRLQETLPKEDTKELIRMSLLFRLGKISALEYYKYICCHCEELGSEAILSAKERDCFADARNDRKVYSNLRKYIHLLKLQSKINENQLLKEIDILTEEKIQGLIQTEDERVVYKTDKSIKLLNKLFRLEISREEMDYYKANREEFSVKKIAKFLNMDEGLSRNAEKNLINAEEFYRLASERDEALVENLIRKMEKENKGKAVIIAGGFHSEGIQRELGEKGISCTVVTPKITKIQENNPYLGIMTDEDMNIDALLPENIGLPLLFGAGAERIRQYRDVLSQFAAAVTKGQDVNDLLRNTGDKEIKEKLVELFRMARETPDYIVDFIRSISDESIKDMEPDVLDTIVEYILEVLKLSCEEYGEDYDDRLRGLAESVKTKDNERFCGILKEKISVPRIGKRTELDYIKAMQLKDIICEILSEKSANGNKTAGNILDEYSKSKREIKSLFDVIADFLNIAGGFPDAIGIAYDVFEYLVYSTQYRDIAVQKLCENSSARIGNWSESILEKLFNREGDSEEVRAVIIEKLMRQIDIFCAKHKQTVFLLARLFISLNATEKDKIMILNGLMNTHNRQAVLINMRKRLRSDLYSTKNPEYKRVIVKALAVLMIKEQTIANAKDIVKLAEGGLSHIAIAKAVLKQGMRGIIPSTSQSESLISETEVYQGSQSAGQILTEYYNSKEAGEEDRIMVLGELADLPVPEGFFGDIEKRMKQDYMETADREYKTLILKTIEKLINSCGEYKDRIDAIMSRLMEDFVSCEDKDYRKAIIDVLGMAVYHGSWSAGGILGVLFCLPQAETEYQLKTANDIDTYRARILRILTYASSKGASHSASEQIDKLIGKIKDYFKSTKKPNEKTVILECLKEAVNKGMQSAGKAIEELFYCENAGDKEKNDFINMLTRSMRYSETIRNMFYSEKASETDKIIILKSIMNSMADKIDGDEMFIKLFKHPNAKETDRILILKVMTDNLDEKGVGISPVQKMILKCLLMIMEQLESDFLNTSNVIYKNAILKALEFCMGRDAGLIRTVEELSEKMEGDFISAEDNEYKRHIVTTLGRAAALGSRHALKALIRLFYSPSNNRELITDRGFGFAFSNIDIKAVAGAFGINIKLARYLKEKGGYERLLDAGFRNRMSELAYNLNREVTLHPAERRLGEDEKMSLFVLLFSLEDINLAKETFDEFFRNDPKEYCIEIERLNRLLQFVSIENLRKIIRAVTENPKESLDEIRSAVRDCIAGQPNADFIVREMEWILSNLFVLQNKIEQLEPLAEALERQGKTAEVLRAALSRVDKAKKYSDLETAARDNDFSIIDVLRFKLESVPQETREDIITDALESMDKITDNEKKEELFSELTAQFGFQPEQSRMRIYFKLLFKLSQDNKYIKAMLSRIQEGKAEIKRAPLATRFLNENRTDVSECLGIVNLLLNDDVPKEVKKQLRSMYQDRMYSEKKVREFAEANDLSYLYQKIQLPKQVAQIPHIYFESLLRIGADKAALSTLRHLVSAMNENKDMHNQLATLKNILYEKLVQFSSFEYERKGEVFCNLLEVIKIRHGIPSAENAGAFYHDLILNLERYTKTINVYLIKKSSICMEILDDLLQNKRINDAKIRELEEMLARENVNVLLARFKIYLNIEDEGDAASKLSRYAQENPRFKWTDHQGRNIFELIDIYLRTISDEEIYRNIFDALMAEVEGNFKGWRYESEDYKRTIDEIIEIEAEKLSEEEKARFKESIEGAEGKTLYEKLRSIEGYEEIKVYIERIRRWEETLQYQTGEEERAEFTDDFYALFNIGNYKGSTACQSCTYGSQLNRGLAGYSVNGTNKAVVLLDKDKRVVTRRIVRLRIVRDKDTRERCPVIFVEESTQFGTLDIDKLYTVLDILSKRTGLPVAAGVHRSSETDKVKEGTNKVFSMDLYKGRSSFDYSDFYGNILGSGQIESGLYCQGSPEVTMGYLELLVKPANEKSEGEIEEQYGLVKEDEITDSPQMGKRTVLRRINVDSHGEPVSFEIRKVDKVIALEHKDIDKDKQKKALLDLLTGTEYVPFIELVFSMFAEEGVSLYGFSETVEDFRGFASIERRMVALHESLLNNPIAFFHEIMEYLADKGRIRITQSGDDIFVKNNEGNVLCKITLADERTRRQTAKIKALSYKRNHYLIRALQSRMFGRADEALTKKIKSAGNRIIWPYTGQRNIRIESIIRNVRFLERCPGRIYVIVTKAAKSMYDTDAGAQIISERNIDVYRKVVSGDISLGDGLLILSPDFTSFDEESKRLTVMHELAHMAFLEPPEAFRQRNLLISETEDNTEINYFVHCLSDLWNLTNLIRNGYIDEAKAFVKWRMADVRDRAMAVRVPEDIEQKANFIMGFFRTYVVYVLPFILNNLPDYEDTYLSDLVRTFMPFIEEETMDQIIEAVGRILVPALKTERFYPDIQVIIDIIEQVENIIDLNIMRTISDDDLDGYSDGLDDDTEPNSAWDDIEEYPLIRIRLDPFYENNRITLPEALSAKTIKLEYREREGNAYIELLGNERKFKARGVLYINKGDAEFISRLDSPELIIHREYFGENEVRSFEDMLERRALPLRLKSADGRVYELGGIRIDFDNFEPSVPFSSFEEEKEFYGIFPAGTRISPWRFVSGEGVFHNLSFFRWLNLLPLYTFGYSHDNTPFAHIPGEIQSLPREAIIASAGETKDRALASLFFSRTGETDDISENAGRLHAGYIKFIPDPSNPVYREFEAAVNKLEDADIIEHPSQPGVRVLRVMVPDEIVHGDDVMLYQDFMERKWIEVLGVVKQIVKKHYDTLVRDRGRVNVRTTVIIETEQLLKELSNMEMFRGLDERKRTELRDKITGILDRVKNGEGISEGELYPLVLFAGDISLKDKFELVAKISKIVNSVAPDSREKGRIVAAIEGEILKTLGEGQMKDGQDKEMSLLEAAKKIGEKKGIPPSEIQSIFDLFRDGIDILTMDPELDPGQIDGSYFALIEQIAELTGIDIERVKEAFGRQELGGKRFKLSQGEIIEGTRLYKIARRLGIYNKMFRDTVELISSVPAGQELNDAVVVFHINMFKDMPLVGLKTVLNGIKGTNVKLGLRVPDGWDKQKVEEWIEKDWELAGNVILLPEDIENANSKLGANYKNISFVLDGNEEVPKGIKVFGAEKGSVFHAVFLFGLVYACADKADGLGDFLEAFNIENPGEIIEKMNKREFFKIKLARIEEILEEFKNRRIYIDIAA